MVAFSNSPSELTPEQADNLLRAMEAMAAIERMSDIQLSQACIDEVWGSLPPGRAESLINELLNRFEALAGIERDEETGEVVS